MCYSNIAVYINQQMKNYCVFKRTKQPACEASAEFMAELRRKKEVNTREASRKGPRSTQQGTISNTAKKGTGKVKGNNQPIKTQKHIKADKKSELYNFDIYEGIFNSDLYQQLSKQHSLMKAEMNQILGQLKSEIMSLNRQIDKEEVRLQGLQNLRDDLSAEIDYLTEIESDIKLRNYDLRCQLLAAGGGNMGTNYYDSQRVIAEEELNYEEMMELGEQMGVVSVGFDENTVQNLKGQPFAPCGGEEEQCCICCQNIGMGERIFRTNCEHVHHLECISRWLRVKRECPLCRCEIVLK